MDVRWHCASRSVRSGGGWCGSCSSKAPCLRSRQRRLVTVRAWAAPLVVSMLASTDNPVRLVLETDWRALAFSLTLATSVTCLFGLAPAIRASSFGPVTALKGGADPRGHRRVMKWLVAAQMAFCVFVLFVAVLFAATLTRLLQLPLGFSHEHVLLIDAQFPGKPQPVETWAQIVDRLQRSPGVESAAFSGWTFLSGSRWSGQILIAGRAPEARPAYLLEISPRFFETLNIPLIAGVISAPAMWHRRSMSKMWPPLASRSSMSRSLRSTLTDRTR